MSQDESRLRDRSAQPTEAVDGEVDWGLQLEPGRVIGGRYRIRSLLGAGGMGEVWHAFDLKLRVEVALKALRPELFRDESRLELLRTEVRTAREVMSSNVCRIFDLVEVDGRELVSMEYVDGQTLLAVLQDRGPLELKEAQDIASQFLAGLEAIHKAKLVHRDIKPENIMVTRAGRVVLMDFGLARQDSEGSGSVAGTPAYMAPEQAAGLKFDARVDVYSAGVVLAEMVNPEGVKSLESRQSVWEGIRQEPAKVPESPWKPVLKRAVAKDRDQRYNSAHTLTRALEDVTLRVEGADDLTPYPGLASFTEADAEYFFGREAEVERIWRRLDRPRVLAIVGPSGSGKTSFIRAGIIPSAESDWAIVRCTPGNAALASLRRALASEISDDSVAVGELAVADADSTVSAYSRWRARHGEALLIVDQFEELFTLNSAREQPEFAELLGRLVVEADVYVLLSMRDDFLMHCRDHAPLEPVFSDLTALPSLTGGNLRRALVQPAMKCGYRFEDDELVDEMLSEVDGERGALPLLAFAAVRVWEKRDRESGLLTRQAYNDIGGVGGALARHAEATLERIGADRLPIVRELFRNLVTSEGTRAVREWDELLSVYDDRHRESAENVLRELTDARLLTTYEVREEDREPTRRVEIIHESLLVNWPRLVRWQTQDADSVRLRDELRQAARTWDEHHRTHDLLWTGSAYREFAVWRERYPGGLTELEEAFGSSMTHHAERRRRRRRATVAATFVVMLAVLAVIGVFWRRSVAETRRAEAANLFSLAQFQLGQHPTATIAYSIASLELADSPEVRRLALEALWLGPTEFRLETDSPFIGSLDFSVDGRWLATVEPNGRGRLWPSDGGPPTLLEGEGLSGEIRISPTGDLVAAPIGKKRNELKLWSFPGGRLLRSLVLGDHSGTLGFQFSRDGERLFTSTEVSTNKVHQFETYSWSVKGGEPDLLARVDIPEESHGTWPCVDPTGSRFAWADGRSVRIARLDGTSVDLASATSVEHDRAIAFHMFDGQGRCLATVDAAGEIGIWSLERDPPRRTHTLSGRGGWNALIWLSRSGSMLAATGGMLWDLTAPMEAEPLQLRHPGPLLYGMEFAPDDRWFAASCFGFAVSLWPLDRSYPLVLRGHEDLVTELAFTPDGKRLTSISQDGTVRVWPLRGGTDERSRILHRAEGVLQGPGRLAMAADGSFLAVGHRDSRITLMPLEGQPIRELSGFDVLYNFGHVAVGPRARLVAACTRDLIRIWNLESGDVSDLDPGQGSKIFHVKFSTDADIWAAERGTMAKLQHWQLDGESARMVEERDLSVPDGTPVFYDDLTPDGRGVLLGSADGRLWIQDVDTHVTRELIEHAGRAGWAAFGPAGEAVVSVDAQGGIRVSPVTGNAAHLLLGCDAGAVRVSPDGRWVAAACADSSIRVWPMPDLAKPPLHTLPRGELIAKLKTLTNLRAVADKESPTGWKIEVGPFPGWETVPSW